MEEIYICEMCRRAFGPKTYPGLYVLKTFRGYTVDLRLQQFRKVILHEYEPGMETIEFTEPKGRELLSLMHEEATR